MLLHGSVRREAFAARAALHAHVLCSCSRRLHGLKLVHQFSVLIDTKGRLAGGYAAGVGGVAR